MSLPPAVGPLLLHEPGPEGGWPGLAQTGVGRVGRAPPSPRIPSSETHRRRPSVSRSLHCAASVDKAHTCPCVQCACPHRRFPGDPSPQLPSRPRCRTEPTCPGGVSRRRKRLEKAGSPGAFGTGVLPVLGWGRQRSHLCFPSTWCCRGRGSPLPQRKRAGCVGLGRCVVCGIISRWPLCLWTPRCYFKELLPPSLNPFSSMSSSLLEVVFWLVGF